MTTIYAMSGIAALSALFAFARPSMWAMFAAGTLNAFAAYFLLASYFAN